MAASSHGIEESIIVVIENARYMLKALPGFEPNSPGDVLYRARLREMRRTVERQIGEVQALAACAERDHLLGLLTLVLSEIPPGDTPKTRMQ